MSILSSKLNILFFYLVIIGSLSSQVESSYYLPDLEYNPDIQEPKDFLGHQIGEWHITHDQLYYYLKELCASSPKCLLEETGRTHENRHLVNLIITSPQNHQKLEDIIIKRRALVSSSSQKPSLDEIPLVIYQGYSIHGNESSGSNAVPLVAYYLLAGESDYLDRLLDETVIILDPSYNPDGLNRFATWANMHKHNTLSPDASGREFNEVWPGGRTNHYWFDLNRDWIFNIHPSSKARIKQFQKYLPDILTDHHEMGSNSTFFFQPGVPGRTNPNTPLVNQTLTEEMARYHASNLDSIGSLYFTKERFDDFYYGKGSTYPDINGCIGILFEQASARGHYRETTRGILTFPFSIRNQFVTSLSTQKAGLELKERILTYKRDFYKKAYKNQGAFIFGSDDIYKNKFFIELLNRHNIDVYNFDKKTSINGMLYSPGEAFIVPKGQRQSGLVKTIFEKVNAFQDSIFYDVSAWTLPLAFNIDYSESDKNMTLGTKVETLPFSQPKISGEKAVALAIEWDQYNAPSMLYSLLREGLKITTLQSSTTLITRQGEKKVEKGTLLLPLNTQSIPKQEILEIAQRISEQKLVNVLEVTSGFSKDGFSIAKAGQKPIVLPKIAMVVGEKINAYEAGSTWYQLDKRLNIPFTKLDLRQFKTSALGKYNIIILPDGRYDKSSFPGKRLTKWVEDGGTLISMRSSIELTNHLGLTQLQRVERDKRSSAKIEYDNISLSSGANVIGGAILQTKINIDHPLFFGYTNTSLPVFKKGTDFYQDTENVLSSPMHYTSSPLISGYASNYNQYLAADAVGVHCSKKGKGKVIALIDNPNFRGYWLGGSRLFANALFFADLIHSDSLQR